METLFSGIAAVAELAMQLVQLFFSGFGNLGRAIDSELQTSERRKNALLATAKLGLPTMIVGSLIGYVIWYEAGIRALNETQQIVKQYADSLDSQKNPDGTYRQVEPGQEDAWGKRLRVTWSQHELGESLIVASAGKDEQLHTQDDITTSRLNLQVKAVANEARRAILRKLKERQRD